MKILICFFAGLLVFTFAGSDVFAQKRKITIILMRHAEKDLTDDKNPDPGLSVEGKKRAELFFRKIKKYKPMRVYSTNYQRTKQTVVPLSEKKNLPIQIYDPRKQNELVEQILSFKKSRRIVVVGHSNTIPALVNLLIKQTKYKTMEESEHNKIWIIRIKKGKIRARVIEY